MLGPYVRELQAGMPPQSKLPLYDYKTSGCYGYFQLKLKDIISYPDLRSEVFQHFKGNVRSSFCLRVRGVWVCMCVYACVGMCACGVCACVRAFWGHFKGATTFVWGCEFYLNCVLLCVLYECECVNVSLTWVNTVLCIYVCMYLCVYVFMCMCLSPIFARTFGNTLHFSQHRI